MFSNQTPHRRYNPLTGEWILVSPHRTKRPWQGQTEDSQREKTPEYDPDCYLCPGNSRAGGAVNPDYTGTFVFTNDFSALLPETEPGRKDESELLIAENERGICRVVCFSPRHDLTIPRMDRKTLRSVVDTWVKEYQNLGQEDFISYVQIFENRGAVMGCSNPHPHCQIWSNESIPVIPGLEDRHQREYRENKDSCLLCDYLTLEKHYGTRIVLENDSFCALVPFWAVWPYEVMIIPKSHHGDLSQTGGKERDDLAVIMKQLGIRYDNLFKTSFPYSMGIHQCPTGGINREWWHYHFHYYPPLLRSATVKKFMVGYEMMAMPQRDITAEGAAETLRSLPEKHYLDKE
ncbi:MAG: UDP-glucose--hexose-1-phosphate uridylyltransferase [Spirochaetia bacterium]